MESSSYDTWIEHVTAGDSLRAIAARVDSTHTTIQRRLRNREADAIIELARAYDTNPLQGLIAAGAITRHDLIEASGLFSVDDMSDVELAQLLVDRLEARERDNDRHLRAVSDESPEEGQGFPDDYEP